MTKKWPDKDPEEVLDYAFDWTPRNIAGDPIVTTTADIVEGTGLTVDSHGVGDVDGVANGYGTVTWLSGGTAGETGKVHLHAITQLGRELEQTMLIKIKER